MANDSASNRSDSSDVSRSSALARRRACYEQEVRTAIAHQFPLGKEDLLSLKRLQQELQLPDDIAQAVNRQVMALAAEEEARYQALLQDYEAKVQAVVEKKRAVSDADRRQLTNYLSQWGIASRDAALIEQQVRARFQARQMPVPSEPLADVDQSPASSDGASFSEIASAEMASAELTQLEPLNAVGKGDEPAIRAGQGKAGQPVLNVDAAVLSGDTAWNRDTNFEMLEELLRSGAWQQADHQTYRCLLGACDRLGAGWLDRVSLIETLPDDDLSHIDHLWQIHSGGRFGFSVQRDIFSSVAEDPSPRRQTPTYFGQQVGWVFWDKPFLGFKYYRQLTFNLEAPRGHLPAKWFWEIPWRQAVKCGGLGAGRGGCGQDGGALSALYERLSASPSSTVTSPIAPLT
ncbi:MAG: GUN4 domain-containing protein [Elainellaceae cyanobacterium]